MRTHEIKEKVWVKAEKDWRLNEDSFRITLYGILKNLVNEQIIKKESKSHQNVVYKLTKEGKVKAELMIKPQTVKESIKKVITEDIKRRTSSINFLLSLPFHITRDYYTRMKRSIENRETMNLPILSKSGVDLIRTSWDLLIEYAENNEEHIQQLFKLNQPLLMELEPILYRPDVFSPSYFSKKSVPEEVHDILNDNVCMLLLNAYRSLTGYPNKIKYMKDVDFGFGGVQETELYSQLTPQTVEVIMVTYGLEREVMRDDYEFERTRKTYVIHSLKEEYEHITQRSFEEDFDKLYEYWMGEVEERLSSWRLLRDLATKDFLYRRVRALDS